MGLISLTYQRDARLIWARSALPAVHETRSSTEALPRGLQPVRAEREQSASAGGEDPDPPPARDAD
jgi:hypothetical protein